MPHTKSPALFYMEKLTQMEGKLFALPPTVSVDGTAPS